MISEKEIFQNARWISTSDTRPGKLIGVQTPSLRARRCFRLEKKPARATAYISGLGAFVLYINGKRVSDERLSPAFTNYLQTVFYCEYDVTELLSEGDNFVCVEVGAGFFNQSTYDGWSFAHSPWRDFEKLIFALFADGEELLVSDRHWRVSRTGPRLNTQIRQGETYDSRLADGWLCGDFDDSSWQSAFLTRIPGGEMKKQTMPPIRVKERISPISSMRSSMGVIYDFGKNISGNVRIRARGKRGDTLSIKYGERIIGGELDDMIVRWGIKNSDIHSLEFGDRYVFSGDGTEQWQAEFVYYGFRYALVSGAAEIEEIEADFLYTDFRERGGFHCSEERYNWLVCAGLNSFLSNFHGFSEDCPHREKNGWTGDAAISVDHAVYRFDMTECYRKWLSDITDAQLKSGQLPAIAPTAIYGYTWGSGPAWDHALFVIPDTVYRQTGDDSLFDGIIDAGIKYFEYAKKYEDENSLVMFGLSDWCSPLEITEEEMGDVLGGFDTSGRKRMAVATNRFSDSCYYYKNLSLFADGLSRRLDLRADEYRTRAQKVLSGIRKMYLKDGRIDNDTQSALSMAIHFGVVEGEEASLVAARLAEKVKAGGYKMECGILGTKALFNVLADYGYFDICREMLAIEDYPSYGFWHRHGLMTFPELWEIADGSRNHHMYSDIVNWVYRYIGGIQNLGVAYDVCRISPYLFDKKCGAESFTETPKGRISVKWSREDVDFTAEITIPEGCSATLSVGGVDRRLSVGENLIKIKI